MHILPKQIRDMISWMQLCHSNLTPVLDSRLNTDDNASQQHCSSSGLPDEEVDDEDDGVYENRMDSLGPPLTDREGRNSACSFALSIS